MKRIKAKLTRPRHFELFEEELPALGDHEVLLKMVSVGLCHSDIPAYSGTSAMGRHPLGFEAMVKELQYPMGLGHEPVAIIQEVGRKVTKFAPGDRVTGVSSECFASHMILNEQKRLIKTPDMDKPLDACLGEPMMCVTNILQAAKPAFGDHTAVIGCGFMGLLTVAGLKNKNLGSLTAIDFDEERLKLAEKYGATERICPANEDLQSRMMEITGGKGFDAVIEITGSLKGLASALQIIKIAGRGKLLAPSMYTKNEVFTEEMAYNMMYRSPVIHAVHPWYCEDYMDTLKKAVESYARGIFPTEELITHRIPVTEINEAFRLLSENPKGYIKGIVTFD
ncbi:MAG: zinc-binding dehydrogenase [Dorea sp.]|nr:zinc-binding dehydrogenase [Dorea sp.]